MRRDATIERGRDVCTVAVHGSREYEVVVGRGLTARAAELLAVPVPSAWALVSDAHVQVLHGPALRAGLAAWGDPAVAVTLPDREAGKTWEATGDLIRRLAAAGLDRKAAVVCLGGGSVGDAGGFAAAVYLRAVDSVLFPTTLLAAVDAAIGGKTGVNLPEGKNLAGAFHAPRAVIVDLELLRTLPAAEWRNGWAEIVKIATTSDPDLFEWLERHGPRGARERIDEVVTRACRAKAAIVGADEREAGPRRVLNFGHTVGHAIEAAGRYRTHTHGEAVALGIACMLELGLRLGVTAPSAAARCRRLLEAFELPVAGSGWAPEQLRPYLARDKKHAAGTLTVVLTEDVGRPMLRPLATGDADLEAAIRAVA